MYRPERMPNGANTSDEPLKFIFADGIIYHLLFFQIINYHRLGNVLTVVFLRFYYCSLLEIYCFVIVM